MKFILFRLLSTSCFSIFRGQSTSQCAVPFRQWYTNLGELKSLLLSSTKYAIFTATASNATRNEIFKMLSLSIISTYSIEKPPLRANISYNFVYVRKEQSLENVFGVLIEEIQAKGKDTSRCIIFCQTRKQCSRVYRMFQGVYSYVSCRQSTICQDTCCW